MSETYQAVYDAARRALGNADIDAAVRNAFDISHITPHLQQEIYSVSYEMQRPSVLYRPSIELDGTKWLALYGEDLQSGVAGFGDTPAEAMADFDKNWREQRLAHG